MYRNALFTLLLLGACRATSIESPPGAAFDAPIAGRVEVVDGETTLHVRFWGVPDDEIPVIAFETTYQYGSMLGSVLPVDEDLPGLQCGVLDGSWLCAAEVPMLWASACGLSTSASEALGRPLHTRFFALLGDPEDPPHYEALPEDWLDATEEIPIEIDVDRIEQLGDVDLTFPNL